MSVFVFPAILHVEKGVYGVVFPDLPGCVSVGDTEREIALNATEALSGHLESMMEQGEPIPEPSPLETLRVDSSSGEIGAILVTAYASLAKLAN